jgi:hypothetical protein
VKKIIHHNNIAIEVAMICQINVYSESRSKVAVWLNGFVR